MDESLRILGAYLEANPDDSLFEAVDQLDEYGDLWVSKEAIEQLLILSLCSEIIPDEPAGIVERALELYRVLDVREDRPAGKSSRFPRGCWRVVS